jgi:hypothetical protein
LGLGSKTKRLLSKAEAGGGLYDIPSLLWLWYSFSQASAAKAKDQPYVAAQHVSAGRVALGVFVTLWSDLASLTAIKTSGSPVPIGG